MRSEAWAAQSGRHGGQQAVVCRPFAGTGTAQTGQVVQARTAAVILLLIAAACKVILQRITRSPLAQAPLPQLLCPRTLCTPRRIAARGQAGSCCSSRHWLAACLLLILLLIISTLQPWAAAAAARQLCLSLFFSCTAVPKLPGTHTSRKQAGRQAGRLAGWREGKGWRITCMRRRRCASSASSRCRSNSASSSAAQRTTQRRPGTEAIRVSRLLQCVSSHCEQRAHCPHPPAGLPLGAASAPSTPRPHPSAHPPPTHL